MQFSVRMLPAKFPYRWAHSCTVCVLRCLMRWLLVPGIRFSIQINSISKCIRLEIMLFWIRSDSLASASSEHRAAFGTDVRERERETHILSAQQLHHCYWRSLLALTQFIYSLLMRANAIYWLLVVRSRTSIHFQMSIWWKHERYIETYVIAMSQMQPQ